MRRYSRSGQQPEQPLLAAGGPAWLLYGSFGRAAAAAGKLAQAGGLVPHATLPLPPAA